MIIPAIDIPTTPTNKKNWQNTSNFETTGLTVNFFLQKQQHKQQIINIKNVIIDIIDKIAHGKVAYPNF